MSDEKTKHDKAGRRMIDIDDDNEVRYWSEILGITTDRLRVVVGKVGPMVEKVREELRR
ncbi:MAG TPA: DUF3606 domain-containing protein [Pseudoxanthomonas sp.]